MTVPPTIDPALLAPPDDATVAHALEAFAARVRRHHRKRLCGIYLFGSRARGDHTPESDADVAVVLTRYTLPPWEERRILIKLAYDYGVDSGVYIQPWPFTASDWQNPETASNTRLVMEAKRDARPIRASS